MEHAGGPPAKFDKMFAEIEKWTMTKTKFEVMDTQPARYPLRPDPVHEGTGREPSLRKRPAPWSRSITRPAAST